MKVHEQSAGLASDVITTLSAAHAAAAKDATGKDTAILDDVFTSVLGVLGAHPKDAQATVTASVETGEGLAKVYVDITIVPSEAARVAQLTQDAAASAPAVEGENAVLDT